MLQIILSPKTSRIIDRFANTGNRDFQRAIRRGLKKTGEDGLRKTRKNAPYKKGHLRRSIDMLEYDDRVIIGTNLEYARIQEFGGTIRPKAKKALAFKINGKFVTVKSVKIPAFKGRGYFRPAFQEMPQFGKRNFEKEIQDFINNASK